jgi:dTDP-4-dehydrorhamnose 3,5-epimerase
VPTIEKSDAVEGVLIVTHESHGDARGRFVETYRREWFPDGREMVQGNRSEKQAGAVVGLHFHRKQADYWHVISGRAARPTSSTGRPS